MKTFDGKTWKKLKKTERIATKKEVNRSEKILGIQFYFAVHHPLVASFLT